MTNSDLTNDRWGFDEEKKVKKKEFLYVAESLNKKLDIVPLLFGSLGLEQRLHTNLNADDIDILIPEAQPDFKALFEQKAPRQRAKSNGVTSKSNWVWGEDK